MTILPNGRKLESDEKLFLERLQQEAQKDAQERQTPGDVIREMSDILTPSRAVQLLDRWIFKGWYSCSTPGRRDNGYLTEKGLNVDLEASYTGFGRKID